MAVCTWINSHVIDKSTVCKIKWLKLAQLKFGLSLQILLKSSSLKQHFVIFIKFGLFSEPSIYFTALTSDIFIVSAAVCV